MAASIIYLVCLWTLTFFVVAKPGFGETSNNRPIIGLALKPSSSSYADEFVEAGYVKYLESAGARVVPIRGNQPLEYYEKLFNSINGVLFPGGAVDLSKSTYAFTGRYMYNRSKQAFDNGDYFPIWGTCLGFQLLTVLTAEQNLLKSTDSENITLPLQFVPAADSSRLLHNMPKDMRVNLAAESLTQNNHHYSILVQDFHDTQKLSDFYQILSTSVGRDKKTFVSLIEAKKYPFYGSQFHPEKSIFKWNPNEAINHSFHSIVASQYFANFFINEAKKSSHRFDSVSIAAQTVIENDLDIFVADNTFQENYYFNYTRETLYFKPESHK